MVALLGDIQEQNQLIYSIANTNKYEQVLIKRIENDRSKDLKFSWITGGIGVGGYV